MKGPIGILDSGIGGLTIWSAVRKLLPSVPFVYFSDNAHAPYGNKPPEYIAHRCVEVVDHLREWDIGLCVVACNTATTNAISLLRATYDLPFVGVEPAIKPAAVITQRGVIGVLATAGTLSSPMYQATARTYAADVEVVTVVGKGLVEGIEDGRMDCPEFVSLLQSYLNPFIEKRIDVLVLGCTHYPFLEERIRKSFPYPVTILDSSEAIARRTGQLLGDSEPIRPLRFPKREWLSENGLSGLRLVDKEASNSPGIFLSSGTTQGLTRALSHLGYATGPFE